MLLLVSHVLAFGTWLVAQTKAAPSVPTISIFLKPPGVISLGGSTTICCSCQCADGKFVLYKKGDPLRAMEGDGSRAEFFISNATKEDTAVYNCHYVVGDTVLARGDGLDLIVEEFHLPTPVLSVLPGHEVAAGADVVLRCTITVPNASCYVYLEGQVNTISFLLKNQPEFNISHVHKGNEGRYSCQCFTSNASFSWSPVSQSLDLVVRGETPADYTWSNTVRLALGAGVLLLLGLLVAEAIHSNVLHTRRAARDRHR